MRHLKLIGLLLLIQRVCGLLHFKWSLSLYGSKTELNTETLNIC